MPPQPRDGFIWVDRPAGPALVCAPLEPFAANVFTTRPWPLGSPAGGDRAWEDVAGALHVDSAHLVRLHQVHGAGIVLHRAGELPPGLPRPEADIVLTTDRAAAVAIQTADCVPLLLADARTGAVAAAHAGWRGLAARVPRVAVDAMTRELGTRPDDLHVAIGPSISAARYEVGRDVWDRFTTAGFGADVLARWFPAETRADHWQFDGWQSASDQLRDAGVRADRIHLAGLCTATYADWFCSYRRDGKAAGRMAAAIRSQK